MRKYKQVKIKLARTEVAFAFSKWFEKVKGERKDLENRFHGGLRE